MSFFAIIPARFAASRLPGKPLADINGKPMVVRVMEHALASGADRVIVATDNAKVLKVVQQAGGEACLTRADHQSGTERLAEVITHYGFSNDQIIVNLQGDEPLISPEIIRQVAEHLANTEVNMATLAVPITRAEEAFNTNIVKVVTDTYGYAIYFSRATIPWYRDNFASSRKRIGNSLLRHIGIYAYRAGFIHRYIAWPPSPLEQIEVLEQLRVLWYGEKIYVVVTNMAPSIGVDTLEELIRVRLLLKNNN